MKPRISKSSHNLFKTPIQQTFFVLQFSILSLPLQEFCLLQERELDSTPFHILLCPLSQSSSGSSVSVPFFVARNQRFFCTRTKLLPAYPVFSDFSNSLPSISVLYIFLSSSCTYCLTHLMLRHLLAVAHHSVWCFVTSLFLSTPLSFG